MLKSANLSNVNLLNNSENLEILNDESSFVFFDIKMSNTDSSNFLTDQIFLNEGEDDGKWGGLINSPLFPIDQTMPTYGDDIKDVSVGETSEQFADYPILLNNENSYINEFTIVLGEVKQELANPNLSASDYLVQVLRFETAFSDYADHLALLNA